MKVLTIISAVCVLFSLVKLIVDFLFDEPPWEVSSDFIMIIMLLIAMAGMAVHT